MDDMGRFSKRSLRARTVLNAGIFMMIGLFFAMARVLPVKADDNEAVEEVGNLEIESSGDGTSDDSAGGTLGVMQIIGRNHPAAVHLPIGMLMALCLLEALSLIRPAWEIGKSGMILSIATALSFIPAAFSGFLRANEIFADSKPTELLLEHRNIMIAAFVVFLVSLALRIAKRDHLQGMPRYLYLALLAASLVIVGIGAHHGGQLVYGENYLPY